MDDSSASTQIRHAKLTELRDSLFDLGKGNILLYYKEKGDITDLSSGKADFRLQSDSRALSLDGATPWHTELIDLVRRQQPIRIFLAKDGSESDAAGNKLKNIRTNANRNEKEYGYSPLKLVLAFLDWWNDEEFERSPLLFLPVRMESKKVEKGTEYCLTPLGMEAEVNPVLRHYLEAKGLPLPERLELFENNLVLIHQWLSKHIKTHLPGTTLDLVIPKKGKSRKGKEPKPNHWNFDLTSLVLGNFNDQKMSLFQDYGHLLENSSREHLPFDELIAESAESREQPAPLPLKDQFLIAPADPSQLSAIAWARTGRNLVIQGPPGTGKSQTIANLIADYLARGKRVLFVCEKRAALDVVSSRLTLAGLNSRVSLIHDTRGDRAEFLEDLKETWNELSSGKAHPDDASPARRYAGNLEGDLDALCQAGVNQLDGSSYRKLTSRVDSDYRRWIRANSQLVLGETRDQFHAALLQDPIDPDFAAGIDLLQQEFRRKSRFTPIRELASGKASKALFLLKPVWLMSPRSVSEALPPDNPELFDLVIFDEASQIRIEDGVPALFRGKQTIVVGDEKQLPPTDFFHTREAATSGESDEDDPLPIVPSLLDYAQLYLPSTPLMWHYRSRYEPLIAFNNQAFYQGRLLTIPDKIAYIEPCEPYLVRQYSDAEGFIDSALQRSISYHHIDQAIYTKRENFREANYIAGLVRAILLKKRGLRIDQGPSIGVVTFSEVQRDEIESVLENMGKEDPEFGKQLAAERDRKGDGQLLGLFVKNLEHVQGDERDIIIFSICYGPNLDGNIYMNFGPMNRSGGDRRLNVIFSRAKKHLLVVCSFKPEDITSQQPGPLCLKNYLQFASSVSQGDLHSAGAILSQFQATEQPVAGAAHPEAANLANHLRNAGYEVAENLGHSEFKIDLGLRMPGAAEQELAILLRDTSQTRTPDDCLFESVLRPRLLRETMGWKVHEVLLSDWLRDPQTVLSRIGEAYQSLDGRLASEAAEARG